MNRKTFELNDNETVFDLMDFTPFERSIIVKGVDKLVKKHSLLREATPLCNKDGDPIMIVLGWKYDREMIDTFFDANKLIKDSVMEVYRDSFEKSFIF